MSTLFTINRSWFTQAWLFEQLAFAEAGDAILLIEDGVLSLQSPVALASFMAKCSAGNITVFALRDDIQLRGVENQYASVTIVDYPALVDLAVELDKQVAW